MDRVRVRYVLTGACLPAYSGRVVHAIVSVKQANGAATTVKDLVDHFRTNWPAEMKELADAIAEVPVRVLKTGRVLAETEVFEQVLTASERKTCAVAADEAVEGQTEEMQKPSVLMHMVILKPCPPPETPVTKDKTQSASNSEAEHGGDAHTVKKNSCCCIM